MPLTAEQVTEIVGRLDDLRMAEILASGANLAQITAAKMMLAGGEGVATVLGHDEPETRRVYEILQSEEPDDEERAR